METKIGLVCIGLDGERLDLAAQFLTQARESLKEKNIEVVNPKSEYTLTGQDVIAQARKCRDAGAAGMLYLIGTWVLANHVIDAVQLVDLPIGIWGVPEAASFSSVGANVVHGTMEEMGIKHRMFYGMPDGACVTEEILAWAKACNVSLHLKGARFGLLGGRTINAYPTAADPNQIKALFGIEIESIDQMVLLEKARGVADGKAQDECRRFKNTYKKIQVSDHILLKSAKVYLALKQIKQEFDLDFCSVKCIGEFMNTYTSCCMAVACLNDEGFVTGCQCSVNAGISSYILSRLSGQPAFFGDVNMIDLDKNTARLINCGVIPTKLAASYDDVEWVTQYEYMGKGLGACALFCCKPGKVTFGTLGRREGRYVMNIAQGEAYQRPIQELQRVRTWAQGFVKLDADAKKFYNNILSNHSAMGYGHLANELKEFCRLKDVETSDNKD